MAAATTTTIATLAYDRLRQHIEDCKSCRLLLQLAVLSHQLGNGLQLRLCAEGDELLDRLVSLS